jgi:hypothetical protein
MKNNESHRRLLTIRSALILALATLAGCGAALLVYARTRADPTGSVIAFVLTWVTTVRLLDDLIDADSS